MSKPFERITWAAIKAFREQGIKNTTMEDIAKLAQVSRPNIYRYVQDRDDLIKMVVLDCAANLLNDLKPKQGLWHEVLADLFLQQVRYSLNDDIFMLIVEQASPKAVRLFVDDEEVHTSLNALLLPVINAGRQAGEIRSDLNNHDILYWLHYQMWCITRDPNAHNTKETEILVKEFIIGGLIKH